MKVEWVTLARDYGEWSTAAANVPGGVLVKHTEEMRDDGGRHSGVAVAMVLLPKLMVIKLKDAEFGGLVPA